MTTVMTPTEADLSVANCPLCELGEAPLSRPKRVGDVIAVHADPSMVVFLQPPLQLVAVAPTCHVDDLSHFEAGGLGSFLAALRRVALNVRLVFGCSETTIAPVETPLPKSDGHVCFHVVPGLKEDSADQLESSDPMVQAELLAERLR
jgi:hypothetical protein